MRGNFDTSGVLSRNTFPLKVSKTPDSDVSSYTPYSERKQADIREGCVCVCVCVCVPMLCVARSNVSPAVAPARSNVSPTVYVPEATKLGLLRPKISPGGHVPRPHYTAFPNQKASTGRSLCERHGRHSWPWLSMCSYNFIHPRTGWNHCTHPLQGVHQQ